MPLVVGTKVCGKTKKGNCGYLNQVIIDDPKHAEFGVARIVIVCETGKRKTNMLMIVVQFWIFFDTAHHKVMYKNRKSEAKMELMC